MKKVLTWTGLALGVLAVVGLGLYFVLSTRASTALGQQYRIAVERVAVPEDSAAIARAGHLVEAVYNCTGCHGADLAGRVMLDGPLGRFVASNLTPAGAVADYRPKDWDRAIRHGVRPNGKPMVIMPSHLYQHLSDDDLGALVAHLRALPPVENTMPAGGTGEEVRPLGRVLIGTGAYVLPAERIRHNRRPPPSVPPGPTAAYGAYLASVSCVECHGGDLRGGEHPDPAGPPSPSLAAAAGWSPDEFVRAMRTGVTPAGRRLDPRWMPWEAYRKMTDDELAALHAHLRATVPPASA